MASSARIDELKKKFDENPRRYFAPLANEYRKAGDPEQAIAICREFLPQQPGHMSGHIVFGQALYDAQQFEEARSVFGTALTLDPENLIALRCLGDIARGLGDNAVARVWYQRVLDADPRNDEIAAIIATLPTEDAVRAPEAEPAVAETAVAEPAEPPAAAPDAGAPPPTVAEAEAPPADVPEPSTEAWAPGAAAPVSGDETATSGSETPGPGAEAAEPAAAEVAEPEAAEAAEPAAAAPEPSSPPPTTVSAGSAEAAIPAEGPVAVPSAEADAAAEAPASPPPEASAPPDEELLDLDEVDFHAETPAISESDHSAEATELLEFEVERSGEHVLMPETGIEPAQEPELDEPMDSGDQPSATTEETEATPAAGAPAPEPIATETMAELYLAQGHAEDALVVFRQLLAQRPDDILFQSRVASLEAQLVGDAPPAETPQVVPDLDASGFSMEPAPEEAETPPAEAQVEAGPPAGLESELEAGAGASVQPLAGLISDDALEPPGSQPRAPGAEPEAEAGGGFESVEHAPPPPEGEAEPEGEVERVAGLIESEPAAAPSTEPESEEPSALVFDIVDVAASPEPEPEAEPQPTPETGSEAAAVGPPDIEAEAAAGPEVSDMELSDEPLEVVEATVVTEVVEASVDVSPEAEEAPGAEPTVPEATAAEPAASIREFLAVLASRVPGNGAEQGNEDGAPVGDAAPPAGGSGFQVFPAGGLKPGEGTSVRRGGSVDAIFDGSAVAADESAATALAGGFGGVVQEGEAGEASEAAEGAPMEGAPARRATEELSLDSVFREPERPRVTQPQGFSFDRFFANPTPAMSSPAAEAPPEGQAPESDDDIEQFNSWLDGLKKR